MCTLMNEHDKRILANAILREAKKRPETLKRNQIVNAEVRTEFSDEFDEITIDRVLYSRTMDFMLYDIQQHEIEEKLGIPVLEEQVSSLERTKKNLENEAGNLFNKLVREEITKEEYYEKIEKLVLAIKETEKRQESVSTSLTNKKKIAKETKKIEIWGIRGDEILIKMS